MRGGATPGFRGTGPSRLALLALALSAIALLATSQAGPYLAGQITGEAVTNGGEQIDRTLRIHVGAGAGPPESGTIDVAVLSASGLGTASSSDVTVSLAGAHGANGAFAALPAFPVERCVDGCDLAYVVRIAASPGVLPGSVIRYRADVTVRWVWSHAISPLVEPDLQLSIDGETSAPAAPVPSAVGVFLAVAAAYMAVVAALHRIPSAGPETPLSPVPAAPIHWPSPPPPPPPDEDSRS